MMLDTMRKSEQRMSPSLALRIWRMPSLTCVEAVARMTGWSQAGAYRELGKRNVPVGRRRILRERK